MNMVAVSTMESTKNIKDFVTQMEAFEASDQARQKLFAHILEGYSALLEENDNLKNDLASERDNRRNYQKLVDQMQRQLGETHRELADNSFVLALIDGDGVIFQDVLLQAAGHNGGSEAASRLHDAVREHIASLYENSGSWPIMVQIYLSLDKLAQKLASVNLLQKPQDFRNFAQNFALNQSLFTIIDVGHGKERADHKIKEMLRTFSDNPTCRHIIFGGCHDAGYLLNLDQYKHNPAKASRITLLESTPAWRGFLELPNFQRANFDNVFRKHPLPESTHPFSHASVQPPISATSPPPNFSRITTSPSPPLSYPNPPPGFTNPPPGFTNPPPGFADGSSVTSSPATTVSSLANPTSEPSGESSWAIVGKSGVSPNENISIASKPGKSSKLWAYYNKNEQRLDEPLPPRDKTAFEAIELRMKKAGRNLCNHYHLGRGQCINKECPFQHEPRLTVAETVALKYKARSLPCKDRYCPNVHCYLGHQCSFERDTGHCPYPETCNLRATHGMDKEKYSRWDEQGKEETRPRTLYQANTT